MKIVSNVQMFITSVEVVGVLASTGVYKPLK